MRAQSLHHIAEAYRTALRRLEHAVRHPRMELEELMAAIDDLRALEPRLDAVIAAIPNDTATAVANATAALTQQLADAKTAADASEAALASEVATMTPKVAALETAVGIAAPAPAEPAAPVA